MAEAEQSWVVDLFRPEDAEGVAGLYRAIYGDLFPMREVYQPDWHVEQDRTHNSYRVVARAVDGSVIGTAAIFRSTPTNPELYEVGGGMVLPEYGKQNVAMEVLQFTFREVPSRFDIGQIWGEGVCNHLFTQMYFIKEGGVPCALEVDLLPEGSFKSQSERGLAKEGRVSALVISRIFYPVSQTVYLPPAFRDAIAQIYEPFQLEYTFLEARGEYSQQQTAASVDIMETARLCRITIRQIGADFADWLRQSEYQAEKAGIIVFQVILPLDTSDSGIATECLKNEGYWLGGLMPGWYGADGLLLQKTLYEPDFKSIKVYSKRGKEILAMVQADCEKRMR